MEKSTLKSIFSFFQIQLSHIQFDWTRHFITMYNVKQQIALPQLCITSSLICWTGTPFLSMSEERCLWLPPPELTNTNSIIITCSTTSKLLFPPHLLLLLHKCIFIPGSSSYLALPLTWAVRTGGDLGWAECCSHTGIPGARRCSGWTHTRSQRDKTGSG